MSPDFPHPKGRRARSLLLRPLLGATALAGMTLAALWTLPAGGASTGASALYMPQGQDSTTDNGDFVTSDDTTGGGVAGLNTFYSYFVEVPSGLSRLVVELFDADHCVSCDAEQDAQRDRERAAPADNVFAYSLLDPSGVVQAVESSDATTQQPGGGDNAWLALLDTNFPAFAGSATAVNAANVTSLTVAKPTDTQANDLLIFIIAIDGDSNSTAINTPTGGTGGWTLVNEGGCAGGGGGTCRLGVFRRIALGGDPATYSVTWTGAEEAAGMILRYTGVSTATPIDVSGAGTGTSATPTAPTATTTVANTQVLRIYAADNDVTPAADGNPYPAGLRGRLNFASSATDADAVTVGAADTLQATAGATGTAAFDIDASQEWRAVTLAIRPDSGNAANGHWELRVDTSAGNDLNALGIRAHDGTSGAGGTELPVYYDSHNQFGVNPDQDGDITLIKDYDAFPWITSGCTFFHNDFDYDSNQANNVGSVRYTSRSTAFTQLFDNDTLATNDVWQRDTIPRWTTDALSTDYGIWRMDAQIRTYTDGGSGNYANIYVGNFNAANPATDPPSQPEPNTFRVYLPTDTSATTAPVKPYLEQLLTCVSDCPPSPAPDPGDTTRLEVTLRVVNPTAHAITFSSPSNVVTSRVPGSGTVYAGNAVFSQGSIVSQPSLGGTGDVVWNPGTLAAGATAILGYRVDVTYPAMPAGSRVLVTGSPTSNGTTATYRDETGNTSQSRALYTLGPICELATTQGVATHALLGSFGAYVEAGRRILAWETTSEVGTLGFRLLRVAPAQRRWLQVHEGLLPADPAAPAGALYRFADEAVSPSTPGRYLLVEVDRLGRERTFGPLTVDGSTPEWRTDFDLEPLAGTFAATARPTSPALIERLARREAELRATLAERNSVPATGIKVLVRQTGLHYLSPQALGGFFGVGPANIRTWIRNGRLRLTLDGRHVAVLAAPGGDGLYFHGQAADSPFSLDNVYRLERYNAQAMAATYLGDPSPAGGEPTYLADLHAEVDRFAATVLPLDPSSDYWFWEGILAGHPTLGSKSFTVAAPGAVAAAQAASLTVRLQGATASGVPAEHAAQVRVNGVEVGEATWQGIAAHTASFSFAASLLAAGDNLVEVAGVLGPGVPLSGFYVDSLDLAYPRSYRALGEALVVRGDANGVVTVEGFTHPQISVLDLTDQRRPKLGTGVRYDGEPGNYRASFVPASPSTPYLVVSASGVLTPAALVADAPSALRSPTNRARYLVIAPAELSAAAGALAALRRSQGLSAMVVDLADVYDEFSFGQPTPEAISGFLAYAVGSWTEPPRYLVLAGDGSFDYRDLLGFGGNLVPPRMVATASGLFAADNGYADFEGNDGVPELAVGRLPVLTAEELFGYVQKLSASEASRSALPDSVVFVADDVDQAADFGAQAERLAQFLGAHRKVHLELGDLPLATLRQQLFAEAAAGTGLVAYLGHGGPLGLADEGILTSADAAAFADADPPLVLAALTCSSNRFELPGFGALSEALLIEPQGGAAAVWAPSGLALHPEAEILGRELLRIATGTPGLRVGDVVREALSAYVAAGGSRELAATYNLLGDPAVPLKLAPTPGEPGPPGVPTGE